MRKSRKTQNPRMWRMDQHMKFDLLSQFLPPYARRNLSRSPLRSSQCVQKGNSREQQTEENKLGTFISLSLSDNKFASVLLSSSSLPRSRCMSLIIKKSSHGIPCVAIQYFPATALRSLFASARDWKQTHLRRLFALDSRRDIISIKSVDVLIPFRRASQLGDINQQGGVNYLEISSRPPGDNSSPVRPGQTQDIGPFVNFTPNKGARESWRNWYFIAELSLASVGG